MALSPHTNDPNRSQQVKQKQSGEGNWNDRAGGNRTDAQRQREQSNRK